MTTSPGQVSAAGSKPNIYSRRGSVEVILVVAIEGVMDDLLVMLSRV